MPITAKHINGKQRAWLIVYERVTGFEPLHQDELDAGVITFNELVRHNIKWFEEWSTESMAAISTNPPLTED